MSPRAAVRVQNWAHNELPWRIHDLTRDFRLEDVWALPTPGARDGFPVLVRLISSGDPARNATGPSRVLWRVRWRIGKLLGWDGPVVDQDSKVSRLAGQLPEDLRRRHGPEFRWLPFTSLYLTDDEWAAEVVNRTVHGVMHVGWVASRGGGYRGQMAVYVKPRGLLGAVYMVAIRPFRRLIVYPQMMRNMGRRWRALQGDQTA